MHGHHDLEWYDPTEKTIAHKLPCKVRCAYCHSPIMDEGRNMILLFPSLIHLKTEQDRAYFKPRYVWYLSFPLSCGDGVVAEGVVGDYVPKPPILFPTFNTTNEAENWIICDELVGRSDFGLPLTPGGTIICPGSLDFGLGKADDEAVAIRNSC